MLWKKHYSHVLLSRKNLHEIYRFLIILENMVSYPVGHVASISPRGTKVYDRDLAALCRNQNDSIKKTVNHT